MLWPITSVFTQCHIVIVQETKVGWVTGGKRPLTLTPNRSIVINQCCFLLPAIFLKLVTFGGLVAPVCLFPSKEKRKVSGEQNIDVFPNLSSSADLEKAVGGLSHCVPLVLEVVRSSSAKTKVCSVVRER